MDTPKTASPPPFRKILHLDLDAFYCAVEEQHDPSLVGVPFAVGGRPEERGVVSSCSYAARRHGVRSAMPMARALKLCPELRIVAPDHKAYARASERVMQRLRALTQLVEQISIDEAFLDVTDLPEPGEKIARTLQTRIRQDLGLPCSLGVATNKLLAKTANDIGKASARGDGPPNAITVVSPGEEANFLAPLPVEALWGVGPKTAERLAEINVSTIGDLARQPAERLIRLLGKLGSDLSLRARGIDDRPIITHHEPKSFSQEITFARDIHNEDQLRHTLQELSARVGNRLRRANRVGATVKLKIRWPDFTTLTRQITLPTPSNDDNHIYEAAAQLFEKIWRQGQPVRLIGVGVSGLDTPSPQLSLWDYINREGDPKEQQLHAAVEVLRQRYGKQIVQRASDIKTKTFDDTQ